MKRRLVMFTALILLLLLVPACGKGNEKTPAPTATPVVTAIPVPTATAAATPTPNPTATPTANAEPVKIGAISSWSGPAALSGTAYADPVIKLVEKQVKDMGGILGGRPVEVVKYDNRASVAEAVAGVKKLVLEDKVSALTLGGVSAAEFAAIADAAEEVRVPFVCFSGFVGIEEKKFTVASAPAVRMQTTGIVDLVAGVLKPKTVAFMQMQEAIRIELAKDQSKRIEAAGAQTVYMQDIPFGTSDFAPYLTKIKYLNPDVLVLNIDSEQAVAVAKQIMELGGWGNIRVVSLSQALSAANMPGAEGWIVLTTWVPGLDYPASLKFEQDYQALNGRLPNGNHVYFYINLLTAIEAIKFAGTDDPVKIAQALRSGNLEFDTPMGIAHFTSEGESGLKYMYAQIQTGGKIVPFKQ